jgi:cytochrome c oxidase cbb3-type subunit 4
MLESIDINLARGVALILLIIAFLGIWAWAWSKKRKAVFHAASMLPLEEDDGRVPSGDAPGNSKNNGKTQAGTKE